MRCKTKAAIQSRSADFLVTIIVCVCLWSVWGEGGVGSGGDLQQEENRIVSEVCWQGKDVFWAGYVVGKTFELLLGPAVLKGEIDSGIPFLQLIRQDKTYKEEGAVPKSTCELIVRNMVQGVQESPAYKRYQKILSCAQKMLQRDDKPLSHSEETVVVSLASSLARWGGYPDTSVCEALKNPGAGVRTWVQTVRRAWEQNVMASAWQDNAAAGASPTCEAADECEADTWRECESARDSDKKALKSGLVRETEKAVQDGLSAVQSELPVQAQASVRSEDLSVLDREPDDGGLAFDVAQLQEGGSKEEDVLRSVATAPEHRETDERPARERYMDQARRVFLDVLLRVPEDVDAVPYGELLQSQAGDEAKMRRILHESQEYRDICGKQAGESCEKLKKEVADIFQTVLEREPEVEGLSSYVREVALGHITIQDVTDGLRNSDEYRNVVMLRHDLLKAVAAERLARKEARKRHMDQARRVFLDVLLRVPEDVDAVPYSELLYSQAGDEAEMRRILQESQEYRDICGKQAGESCEKLKKEVADIFQTVLEREPEVEGLSSYVREVALGHITIQDVTDGLRNSDEYRHVIMHRHDFLKAVEAVKYRYAECGRDGTPKANPDAQPTPQNFTDPYWVGRWCYRGACNGQGGVCGTWPVHVYDKIQAVAWGNAPLDDLTAPTSSPASEEMLRKFKQARGDVVRAYVDGLARFPDPGALKDLTAQIARGALSVSELVVSLRSSDEYAEKIKNVQVSYESIWKSVDSVANLLVRHRVPFPADVEGCFTADAPVKIVRRDGTCSLEGGVLHALMHQWNDKGPLLGAPRVAESERLFPIAMYVHNRPHYFKQVLQALQRAAHVDRLSVLIVSMDSVNDDMIAVAESTDFAPLRFIFHPPRADFLRLAPLNAVKSHWMWLQDQIWGGSVREIKDVSTHVALLEEDHVVTPDYINMMKILIDKQRNECPLCWGVTVRWGCADSQDSDVFKLCKSHVVINTGIAFDRTTYEAIKKSDFDTFVDGWDWSLFHLAQTGQMNDMMIGPAASRIRNVGVEGVTVSSRGSDFLLKQLDFHNVGDKGAHYSHMPYSSFKLDETHEMQFTPPAWKHLYEGGIDFCVRQ